MVGKWMDNRSVLLLSSALEGNNDISSVQRREKGSKTKSFVPCPQVVKLYHSGMGGVDLMDQRTAAYRLDRKSSVIVSSRLQDSCHKKPNSVPSMPEKESTNVETI